MTEPRWLVGARKYIGEREIKGRKHNPLILRWWTVIRAPFTDDETPWCAAFVGGMLEAAGVKSSRSAAARSYMKWGRSLANPALGCIVVFERGPRNGHVGFLVGIDGRTGNLLILGGNQGDAVNIRAFPPSRLLGYRWPDDGSIPDFRVPKLRVSGSVSRRESLMSVPDDEEAGEEINDPKTGVSEVTAAASAGGVGATAWTIWEKLQQTPDSIITAVVSATGRPQFWIFLALALVAGTLFYFRYRTKQKRRAG